MDDGINTCDMRLIIQAILKATRQFACLCNVTVHEIITKIGAAAQELVTRAGASVGGERPSQLTTDRA
jgi:hypothetical protein